MTVGKLRHGVELLGHVDDIREVWRRAHIAVLPSRREGLPKSLLEAAACGRPLVASDVPGCREIAHDGINALLVQPDDPPALAAAIDRLARDPELRKRFAAAGRLLVAEQFSSDRIGEQTVRTLRPAVAPAHCNVYRLTAKRSGAGEILIALSHSRKIAVIGLGYVGLPVAVAFARSGACRGWLRYRRRRIDDLRAGNDRTREVAAGRPRRNPHFAYVERFRDPCQCRLLHRHCAHPDRHAQHARPGRDAGGFEDRRGCAQARRYRRLRIDRLSRRGRRGMRAGPGKGIGAQRRQRFHGRLFAERINPGDKTHRFETITKVVSAQDAAHARHRRRCLWLRGHGRHSPRAVDQGRRGRQGHREHPARSQHRLHERTIGYLP